MQFTTLAFGPELPPSGARLSARLDSFHLALTLPGGRSYSIALSQVQLSIGGFSDAVWNFEWQDAQGRWAATLDDPASQAALLAKPPAALAAALARLQQAQRLSLAKRRMGMGALGAWLLLPLILLGLLAWKADAIAGRLAAMIPVAQEQKLGEAIWQTQKLQLRLIENTPANAAVEAIGARLTKRSRYQYRFFVARDNSINAFAIPGGVVVVHSGLIAAAKTPEELAGVLAHEVQHVERRHSLKGMAQSLGLSAAMALVTGDIGTAGAIASQLSQLKYSRDHEREADARGVKALKAAQIAPQGMLSLFETLQKQAGSLKPPALLSSHPGTDERIARIQQLIAKQGEWPVQPLALDWPAVQKSLD